MTQYRLITSGSLLVVLHLKADTSRAVSTRDVIQANTGSI